MPTPSRRSFITATVSGLSVLAAGCLGDNSTATEAPGDNSTRDPSTNPTEPTKPAPTPQVELQFDHFETTHLVDISHAGGDEITAENTGEIEVTGDASAGPLVVDESSDAPYTAGAEFFSDVKVLSGNIIEVEWTSNNGQQTKVLGSFKAP
jgi:hypothetical protein